MLPYILLFKTKQTKKERENVKCNIREAILKSKVQDYEENDHLQFIQKGQLLACIIITAYINKCQILACKLKLM